MKKTPIVLALRIAAAIFVAIAIGVSIVGLKKNNPRLILVDLPFGVAAMVLMLMTAKKTAARPVNLKPEFVCLRCRYRGEGVMKAPGSVWISIFLWLFFLVPGILYSLWRISGKKRACPDCGSTDVVDADGEAAKRITGSAAAGPAQ